MRDRKVARTAAQCTGMIAAMALVTPMARSSSESTHHDRPISLHGGRRRIKRVHLAGSAIMSKHVFPCRRC